MADTLRLRYGELAKPVLADRDGEVDTNWTDNGNHSLTADATYAHAGTKSFKIAATNTGDATTNYVSLASGNNGTFTVGRQYVVTVWVYSVPGMTFGVKTGGVASSNLTSVAGTWTACHFTFTAVTATTALQIYITEVGTEPYAMWFELEPIEEYLEFTPLKVRGFDTPDQVEFFPVVQSEALDGDVADKMIGFRRRFDIDLGIVNTAATQKSLLSWMIDTGRRIDWLTEVGIEVALGDPSGHQNNWIGGSSLGRQYTLDLREKAIRTTFPV